MNYYNNTGEFVNGIGTISGFNNAGDTVFAMGHQAAYTNKGNNNIAIGRNSLQTPRGNANFINAIGYQSARYDSTNGNSYLYGLGVNVFYLNNGQHINAIGTSASFRNKGDYNSFIGTSAGQENRGNYSSMLGYQAGLNKTRYGSANNLDNYNDYGKENKIYPNRTRSRGSWCRWILPLQTFHGRKY